MCVCVGGCVCRTLQRIAGSDAGGGEGGSAGSVAPLLPVLSTVLNRGVGLNTKIGAARFIRNLAQRAGNDVRPHAPALIKVSIHSHGVLALSLGPMRACLNMTPHPRTSG